MALNILLGCNVVIVSVCPLPVTTAWLSGYAVVAMYHPGNFLCS